MRWLGVIFLVLLAAVIAAVRYLPWWALILLVVVVGVSWKYLAAGVLWFYMRKVARELGRSLAGANVEVHSLQAVPAPSTEDLKAMLQAEEDEYGDDDEAGEQPPEPEEAVENPADWRWYELDLTISPQPTPEGQEDAGWSVGALMLTLPATMWGEFDGYCIIAQIERMDDGRFITASHWQSYGPERLRLLMGVKPGTTQVALRYMTEPVGEVLELPSLHESN